MTAIDNPAAVLSAGLELAQAVLRLQTRQSDAPWPSAEPLHQRLHELSEACFACEGGAAQALDALRAGTQLMQAATSIGLTAQALHSAARWKAAGCARALEINLKLALGATVRAVRALAALELLVVERDEIRRGSAQTRPSIEARSDEASDDTPVSVLRNIAQFHRAHERFYSQELARAALELSRESNRLRSVADLWLGAGAPIGSGLTDYSAPALQAVGCTDLSAPATVAHIGILFMEGEAEPAELFAIKAKLKGVALGDANAGAWLQHKMYAAWQREQPIFGPAFIDGAAARFETIATNWCGARDLQLAARLLSLATAQLERLDFRPAAIRADRQGAGAALRQIAWTIQLASQLKADFAASLGESDRHWTTYLEVLDRAELSHFNE